jgi:hypothetical protein
VAWLVPSPAGGTSTGPEDARTITIEADRAGLAIGDYTGTLTIGDVFDRGLAPRG